MAMLKRLKAIALLTLTLAASRSFGSIDTVDGIDWWFEVQNGSAVIMSTIPTQTSAIDPNTAGAIVVPSVLGGYPVTAIGPSAFSGCTKLTSVSIPAGVTRIDNSAFYGCSSLEGVALPNGVTSLGDRAFYSCGKLCECELPASVRTIGNSAFGYCSSLTNLVFNEKIESIGSSAFYNCDALQSVAFRGDVGTIGSSAFYNCDALQTVLVEGSINSLGDSAFFRCTKLNGLVFEKDVGGIGTTAFYGCTSLTNVYLGAGLGSMADYVFGNCEALPEIVLPQGVTNLAEGVFYNCRAFTSISFPESISVIPDNALAGCTNLTKVTFTENVKAIGIGAFLNCSKLMDFTLPQNLERIEKRAFEGTAFWLAQADGVVEKDGYFLDIKGPCPSRVEIIAGTKTIVANMFRDCTNLVEVVLPPGLVAIGDYAFYNTGLRTVTFPSGLEIVGERAFAECHSLIGVSSVGGFRCGEGAFEHTGLPSHDVGFDANKGSLPSDETNKTFVVGVPYGPLPTPTRSAYHYRFVGWYAAAKGGALVMETSIVSDSLTQLYAHWETNDPFSYYVRFYRDSATTSYSSSQTLTNGCAHTLRKNDMTKPGYVFDGWAVEKNGPVVYADQATVSNLTTEAGDTLPLYACWRDGAYDVRGRSKACGETAFPVRWTARLDAATAQTEEKRQTISFTVHADARASLVARGLEGSSCPTVELWCKSALMPEWTKVCSVYSTPTACDFVRGTEYQLRVTDGYLTEGCRVYCVGIGEESVDVYFDPGSGTLAESARTGHFIVGLPYEAFPNPTKSEADLIGWFTKAGTRVLESSLAQRAVTNLVARWAPHHTYYVSFLANGGEGTMQQSSFRYGSPSALPENAFVRNFYRFEGWAETADGPVKYADKDVVSDLVEEAGGTKVLYAVWSRIRETVSCQMPSGSVSNDIGSVSVVTNAYLFTGRLTATSNSHVLVFRTIDSDLCRLAVDPLSGNRRGASLEYESVIATDLCREPVSVTLEGNKTVRLVVKCAGLKGDETYEYQASVNARGVQVSYDLNGGTLDDEDAARGTNFNFSVGTALGYLPEPTNREDEVFFLGWYDAVSNRCEATNAVSAKGGVLTAGWTIPTPFEYRIRFDANGAAGFMPEMACTNVVAFSLPTNAFVLAERIFAGWALSANGVVKYGDGARIEKSLVRRADRDRPVVLYARWRGPVQPVTFFYYDTTGGRETLGLGGWLSEPPNARDGYDFAGWWTKPYGGIRVESANDCALWGVTSVYAHWVRSREGYDDPRTWADVVYDVGKAHVYDGYLLNAGRVAGTVRVKTARGKLDRATEAVRVKVSATVLLLGEGKTIPFAGVSAGVGEDGGSCELACAKKGDERKMSVSFRANGLTGGFAGFDIVGARSVFGAKTDWDKRTARAALDDCGESRAVVLQTDGESPFARGYAGLSVVCSTKGKATVSGSLPDGTKVKSSSRLLVFEDRCEIPVVVPLYSGKRGGFGFVLVCPKPDEAGEGVPYATGLSGWEANPGADVGFAANVTAFGVGTVGNLVAPSVFVVTNAFSVQPGVVVDYTLFPSGVEVTASRKKWKLPKADKVRFVSDACAYEILTSRGNPAGLKLSCAAKTGAFKGCFNVYAVTEDGKPKKFTAKVSGVVLDGRGYGSAVIKKVGSVPVVIEAK